MVNQFNIVNVIVQIVVIILVDVVQHVANILALVNVSIVGVNIHHLCIVVGVMK